MKTFLYASFFAPVFVFALSFCSAAEENALPREPYKTALITRWGEGVTAENAWREYPRPQMVRENWTNLNGLWDYAVTGKEQTEAPSAMDGQILVPFAIESRLSGVQRLLQPEEALWYKRTVVLSPVPGKRTLLHFEAVDYDCELRVNGIIQGTHRGGTPFSFDITGALKDGENELLLRVEDPTDNWQIRGKQVLDPHGIWYTRVSGIWQTVWLEEVPERYISSLLLTTDAAKGTIHLSAGLVGAPQNAALSVSVRSGADTIASGTGPASGITIPVHNPVLWTPDTPHLYDLEIALLSDGGEAVDRVSSYAGIRTVGKIRDANGHLRFTLNGEILFHWGPLDQGWWPDGLLTPPSDEAMRSDVEFLKKAGFNMIRKHIKMEPRRYYYACDQLGMMVWQDQPSAGHGPKWTFLKENPEDAEWPEAQHLQYMTELEGMVIALINHPSIVVWVPFNEAWGQHRTMEVGAWMAARDTSRLVNIASGGNFWPVGDIVDFHKYPDPGFPFDENRYREFIKVVGEFGGHGYPVDQHLWNPDQKNWGYGNLPKNKGEYEERYARTLDGLNELRKAGIAAGVYTQTTDVEIEINGLLTYDRAVEKMPAEKLHELSRILFED